MIAREWRGETSAAQADAYAAYLEETGVRECRATPGNLGVLVLRQDAGEVTRFRFLSFWASYPSIRAFAGERLEQARYYPRDAEFLRVLEPEVSHWEVASTAGDPFAAGAVGAMARGMEQA